MFMILVTLGIVGATAYVWCTRGFFSALIHMVCVIAAGAIAFGVWEILADLLRESAPDRGGFAWLSGAALGLGLALPFAISLAVLRGVIDKILPANAQCEKALDYVGGGVCGAVSGIISAGIVVLSAGMLRVEPDFLGYQAASYTGGAGRGSIEKNKETFVPWVDRIVAGMYSHLSLTTLRTGEPLAKHYPDLATYPGELRLTFEGKSRNTVKRRDVSLLMWYTVGDQAKGAPPNVILSDKWSASPQKFSDLDGELISGNHYIAGFTVKFKAAARERIGSTYVGNSQVRLVVESTEDDGEPERRALHPIAVVSRTASATRVAYSRFRYDSDNMYISSVGAESEPTFAFEFAVPAGFKPVAFFVKGVRFGVEDTAPGKKYDSVSQRDREIEEGDFPHMGGVGPILDAEGKPIQDTTSGPTISTTPVTVTASIGFVIQKGTEGPRLTVVDDGKGWAIQDGTTSISRSRGGNTSGLDKALRIERFAVNSDTALVKVLLTPTQRPEEFVRDLETADPNALPVLEDINGVTYQAVGWIYRDSSKTEIRYTQANPIKSFNEIPRVTRNTPDKELTLLFVVNNGVDLIKFRIGDVVLDRWPSARPFHVDMPFRR
ncbi:MAG: hypothetical protein KF678_05035 [Phycisphaeraceae bacterium]|nr:hypothetical protein [Phycisphaeraceae bacterium]